MNSYLYLKLRCYKCGDRFTYTLIGDHGKNQLNTLQKILIIDANKQLYVVCASCREHANTLFPGCENNVSVCYCGGSFQVQRQSAKEPDDN